MDATAFRVNLAGLTSSDFDYIRAAALITVFVKRGAYTRAALIRVNTVRSNIVHLTVRYVSLLFVSSNRLLYF